MKMKKVGSVAIVHWVDDISGGEDNFLIAKNEEKAKQLIKEYEEAEGVKVVNETIYDDYPVWD